MGRMNKLFSAITTIIVFFATIYHIKTRKTKKKEYEQVNVEIFI